ncbi:MAG: DUF87 domain-containing protein [Myxococcota bacterium]
MTTADDYLDFGTEHAYGGARRALRVPTATLLRHAFVLGQTGVGKTTFLLSLMAQIIEQGRGVCFLDPHGDAARQLSDLIPRRRTRNTIVLEPRDIGRPIGFNPLFGVRLGERHRRAAAITEAIRALHADSWGDRLDWILYNSLRALLDCPGSTVLDVPRLLVDDAFRARVVASVHDASIRHFWTAEFAAYDRAFRTVAVSPVQNKVGKLVAHPPLRAILGAPQPRLDFGLVLDRRQIVIADLSGIGARSANLLGSLYLSALIGEAMSRPEGERAEPYCIVIDEAHRFTTEALATALSEARKYNLGLVMADQFLDQTPEAIQRAIVGNVGTMMSFRIGGADAARVERVLGGQVPAEQLADLAPYQAVVRTLDGAEAIGPLRLTTSPLTARSYGRGHLIRREAKRRLGGRSGPREAF